MHEPNTELETLYTWICSALEMAASRKGWDESLIYSKWMCTAERVYHEHNLKEMRSIKTRITELFRSAPREEIEALNQSLRSTGLEPLLGEE
ncbi:MAG: hypothetical protein JW739_08790 [Opitutales bacterium]|nr:hypothetical protein [Opitutales bacterium]